MTLPRLLESASIVTVITVPTLEWVIEMFWHGELDAFATTILSELSDRVRAARVRRCISAVNSNGLVQGAVERAGFRGGNVTGAVPYSFQTRHS